jgi:hypothetical protein
MCQPLGEEFIGVREDPERLIARGSPLEGGRLGKFTRTGQP